MFQIGSAVAHIKADITDFKRGIDAVKAETAGLASTMGSIGSSVKNFANQASIFGLATAGAVGLIGKAGVESAAKFEQYQIAYTTLLKDQKKAAWLEVDETNFKAKVKKLPERSDVQIPIQEQLIVELYSK
jgi:ribosomal protein S4